MKDFLTVILRKDSYIEENPGPGKYENKEGIYKNCKMHLSKFLNSPSLIFGKESKKAFINSWTRNSCNSNKLFLAQDLTSFHQKLERI